MCTQFDSDSIAGVERSEAGVEGVVVLVVVVRFVVVVVVVGVVFVVVVTIVTIAVMILVVVVVLVSVPPVLWFMIRASLGLVACARNLNTYCHVHLSSHET